MRNVEHDSAPVPRMEAEIAVASLAGIEPSQVRGFALLVDNGTPEGIVVTTMKEMQLVLFLVGVLRILLGEES